MAQPGSKETDPAIRVQNLTRGQALVTAGRVADTFFTSLRGLIGHKPLTEGEGLVIVPSNSVHTHFMGFPIDVLYVDKAQKVVAMDQDMVPWRFGRIHLQARFVIELAAGAISATGTQVGDRLEVRGYDSPAWPAPAADAPQAVSSGETGAVPRSP